MRQLWQQSLAPGTGLEINIASFMYLRARCFLPPQYLLYPFFPISLFFSPPPCLHLVTFLKNWRQRREIDVMKNNWDISMCHLLWRYGHPLSPQRASRLSVAIGGILQISQQLSEVTSQVHHWPRSLPSSPLMEPALRPVSAQTLSQRCWVLFLCAMSLKFSQKHVCTIIFICFGTPLIILR